MEIFELILMILDLLAGIIDLIGWAKGKENREQRKEAKLEGLEKPPRDQWSWIVLILTPIFIALTAYLFWRLRSGTY